MAELGFWSIAQEDPEQARARRPRRARGATRGELLASCNQVVHGLRALGLEHGRRGRDACCRTASRCSSCTSPCSQAGFYLVPINRHLVGPEIAYIVQDSEAKAFVAHERFADARAAAADEIGFPTDRPLRGRRRSPASAPTPSSRPASPTTLPERPHRRARS